MKIINRYVLKEHFASFVFALSALTSLLLLQYIARKFGDLVGKGLDWRVITEFMLLSVPFTVAMTLPMSVLVAVLYAFSRLASENEITALKAGGVSTRALMRPALVAATGLAIFMLWFNDQVLPRANHELATLTMAIASTKPTFALREQIVNKVKEGQLYLRAGQIANDESGRMKDVTIYDVSDPNRRRTIYADSGALALAVNRRDLTLRLFHGMMLSAPTNQTGQLSRIYYEQDALKIRDATNDFQSIDADTTSKGDREMSVCEMQKQYEVSVAAVERARVDSVVAASGANTGAGARIPRPKERPTKAGGIGALYCTLISKYFHVQQAQAAEVPRQDTSKQAPAVPKSAPAPIVRPPSTMIPPISSVPNAGAGAGAGVAPSSGLSEVGQRMLLSDAHSRLEDARRRRNRSGVEIQKKFSLAAACIVFVLVGAPIAVRFPRGGVGLVIGASFFIFATYYVGLIGGESLANKNIISPFWAMWAPNVVFLTVGLLLSIRMGRESGTGRGGGFGELVAAIRGRFGQSSAS